MKALVLAGGGSKGSYEIGVWKALRKLNIKFDIVTGTSVGSLNGALVTQKSYFKALRIWKKINLKVLFGDDAVESEKDIEVMKMYKDNFLKHGGMEVSQLEELIRKTINLNRFYKSNINYGLVTYNLTTKKPIQITKKDIPREHLVDYLIASSSCYPAFKQKEIDGDKFIDGGFYDNLPINLALEMGATEIIAVDLSAPGFNRTPKKKVPTIKIKPNNKLTNFLNFYEQGAKRNMKFGYNDTMKVMGKLEGNKYSFKLGHIEKNKNKYQQTFEYTFKEVINNKKLMDTIIKFLKITPTNSGKLIDNVILKTMENLGESFELEETKIYSYKKFNNLLRKKLSKELKSTDDTDNHKIIKMYKKLLEKDYKSVRKEILLSPKHFLETLYLYIICED